MGCLTTDTPLAGVSLLLLGCGKMGGALLNGWLGRGLEPSAVHVVDPLAALPAGVTRLTAEQAVALPPPDVCLVAIKPQVVPEVLPAYAPLAQAGTVFLSVAAGKTIDGLSGLLGGDAAVVRAMPNTPAAVGRGASVLCANARVPAPTRALCETLMAAVGTVEWVDDESLIDAVTALSGGGPAYVFLLVECLAEAGRANGLPADLAMRLARSTVAGSGALLDGSAEDAATLRKNVTSHKGTTAAALAVLMAEDALQPMVTRAIAAAAERSRELAS
ncbi:pyrroline-5-carboxylate reductase [Rhodospirillum rubrum F11]|uniref:pyrroline-5-carboxylate reductase n=1 Tax=Rhodospirillum rubrum TaxID=1085 RepID=UPI000229D451|nr:pyrroline-5-carboxylate reductase [Rhodospirillum rubrum]AEO49822.1 pyrroline-5-carboxylate reductase [Rhodospirillum rubrum F11]